MTGRANLINGRLVRGLTLWRPWPWAFVHAGKRIENRDWPAPKWMIGGYLALHAGKHFDHHACADMREGLFSAAARACPEDKHAHPDSVVFAIAQVTGFYKLQTPHPRRGKDPFAFGPYVWQTPDVIVLPRPVPCAGKQGLWILPDAVFAQVAEQLGKAAVA